MKCYKCKKDQIINQAPPMVAVGELAEQMLSCIHCHTVFKLCLTLKSLRDDYRDPHWLREQYEDKGLSMAAIADMCSVTPMTIQNWLRRNDIETRSRGYRGTDD